MAIDIKKINSEYKFFINDEVVDYEYFLKDYTNALLDSIIDTVLRIPHKFKGMFDDQYKLRQFQAMSLSNQRNMIYAMFRRNMEEKTEDLNEALSNHQTFSYRTQAKNFSAVLKGGSSPENKEEPTADISKRIASANLKVFINKNEVSAATFEKKLRECFLEETLDILVERPQTFYSNKEDIIFIRNLTEEEKKEIAISISSDLINDLITDMISSDDFEIKLNGVTFNTVPRDPFKTEIKKPKPSNLN